MTTEELIKEVNKERDIENRWLKYEKNTDAIMKCANITYRKAIDSGFTEAQAIQLAYAYFSEMQQALQGHFLKYIVKDQ